jgi:hypothetical protein
MSHKDPVKLLYPPLEALPNCWAQDPNRVTARSHAGGNKSGRYLAVLNNGTEYRWEVVETSASSSSFTLRRPRGRPSPRGAWIPNNQEGEKYGHLPDPY